MGNREWFKLFAHSWLHGDIRQEKSIVRDVLTGLCAVYSCSPFGDSNDGEIRISDGLGYTDKQFCDMLNIDLEEWLFAKTRLWNIDCIEIKENNVIKIRQWHKYQSEYRRVRESQLKHKQRLRQFGAKNVNELIQKKVDTEKLKNLKPDAASIVEVLKMLPKHYHEYLKSVLDMVHPDGHEFDKAKEMYDQENNPGT